MSFEISLKAMRFNARVGILAFERETPQPIEVDLDVTVGDAAPPAAVVDYRGLYDGVARVVGAGHIDYLEELVERVAESTLAYCAVVQRVRVAVRKPAVVLGGPLAYAEVACVRSRA